MSKDKLIDLITIGIARACVKEANGETVDKAAEIADVLLENGYRKSSEVAEDIFAEIEFEIHQLDFDREETRAIAIEGIIANAKKKYVEGGE